MITVSFNLAKKDVLALSCHYYATSPTVRKTRMVVQVGIPLVMAGIGLLLLCGGDRPWPLGVTFLVCAVICAAFLPGWYRASMRRTAGKMLDESSYRKAYGSYTLILNDTGIASTGPTSAGNYTWEAVNRVALAPDHLFIFLVGLHGFAIPRAEVPDATVHEVKAFVESHIKGPEPPAATKGPTPAPSSSGGSHP